MKRRIIWIVMTVIITLAFVSCEDSAHEPESEPLTPMKVEDASEHISSFGEPVEELRGVYIATVYSNDFPSKAGLDAKSLSEELDEIVERTAALGCNAIYFQVRPACDAFYKSDIFPVSEYLTGTVGGELPDGFDPLAYLIEIAHERGIQVHAWVNPLRVTRGSVSSPKTDTEALAEGSPARVRPELTVAYAGELYFDVGIPDARRLVADGVLEIVRGYDVDGILFDDYFYPYPKAGYEFDDSISFAEYGSDYSGGVTDIGDWRRENINKMVKLCYETIKRADESCRFGIAPFGIWRNDDGENSGSATSGFESYESLYCDTLAWIRGGYVDYVAPQIYWNFSLDVAPYGVLADWWDAQTAGTGVDLYISHAAYKSGTSEWSFAHAVSEMTEQIDYARMLEAYRGSIMYGFEQIRRDTDGVAAELTECYDGDVLYFSTEYGKYLYME